MSKKNYNFKGNRIIKNDPMEIKSGDIALDPLTLMIIRNKSNESRFFSRFHFDNQELINTTKDEKLKLSDDNFMATPPILIPQNEFLKIYNINDINDLIKYIDDNIDNLFDYNNRIINSFIYSHYKDLIKNNKILTNIYLKLFKNYKINKNDIDKFIKNWFKNNKNTFSINLGNDLENYLSKKYES